MNVRDISKTVSRDRQIKRIQIESLSIAIVCSTTTVKTGNGTAWHCSRTRRFFFFFRYFFSSHKPNNAPASTAYERASTTYTALLCKRTNVMCAAIDGRPKRASAAVALEAAEDRAQRRRTRMYAHDYSAYSCCTRRGGTQPIGTEKSNRKRLKNKKRSHRFIPDRFRIIL